MPNRAIRQIRSIPAEFRVEARDDKKYIEGYFSTFSGIYTLWEGATESVDPHAFDEAISDDVRALIDHDTRLVLGRTKAGTLTLRIDSRGLWGSIEVNEQDSDAMNLYSRIQRGDVDQCSFGFDILSEETDFNEDTGDVHWTIKKVKLYEVSCVTFPAYEDTSISARERDYKELRKRRFAAFKAKVEAKLRHGAETTGTH
ncbi:MAG: HK97 family phage prohead protease [Clostridia bacterium]